MYGSPMLITWFVTMRGVASVLRILVSPVVSCASCVVLPLGVLPRVSSRLSLGGVRVVSVLGDQF